MRRHTHLDPAVLGYKSPGFFWGTREKELDVHSLDFDGCFGKYFEISRLEMMNEVSLMLTENYSGIVERNQAFVDQLIDATANARNKKIVFLVGSNRQTKFADLNAMYRKAMLDDTEILMCTASCFSEINIFVEHIKSEIAKKNPHVDVSLDPFLLADIFYERQFGKTFLDAVGEKGYGTEALKGMSEDIACLVKNIHAEFIKENNLLFEMYSKNPKHHCVFDETKFTLLYAQIHKLASEHADRKINFHFYDDKLPILTELSLLFSHYPELLPGNCTLCLHQYPQCSIQFLSTRLERKIKFL